MRKSAFIGMVLAGALAGAGMGIPVSMHALDNSAPRLVSEAWKRREHPGMRKRHSGPRPRHQGWSVAEGKRRARKRRNQLRHKAHLRRR